MVKRVRKTYDEWVVMGNYGNGFEELCVEETKKAANATLQDYIDNEPDYPHIIVHRLKKIVHHPACPLTIAIAALNEFIK